MSRTASAISLIVSFALFSVAQAARENRQEALQDRIDLLKPLTQSVKSIRVWPESLSLDGPRDARRILVFGDLPGGETIDLTHLVRMEPDGDGLRVDDGYIYPVANGAHKLHIRADVGERIVEVTVNGMEETPPTSFVRDVVPVLGFAGCNSGACHGGAKGRNGFKLSLRGYDQAYDHSLLVDDLSGRRFNRADPDQSLMLLKPTQGVPHEGGQVLEIGSRNYNILRDWIAQGVRSDVDEVEPCDRIEVYPEAPLLPNADAVQQLIVIAHYTDGTTRDVTRDAIFTSSKDIYATVDAGGLVSAVRPGETAILIRYENRYAMSRVSILEEKPGFEWTDPPVQNYIDEHVYNKLKRIKVAPSELCDDATFLRRAQLDLIGTPPTPGEVRAFLHDNTDTQVKRKRKIDQLMDSDAFVELWTMRWADLLQVNRKYVGDKGVWAYRNWIRQSVAENKPIDQFARELLTARGSTYDNPAANFYRVTREPDVTMETAAQLFLGVRMMCAKCHDHPFEQWTQRAYYEMSAYFARVAIKKGPRPGEEIIFENYDAAEVRHPKNDAVMDPHVPFGDSSAYDSGRRVEELAAWVTSSENEYFAKSIANRVWSHFFGKGIIDPVDDLRPSNPASNEQLLAALTEDFVSHGFDMRHLIRTIVNSRVYQLDAGTTALNRGDPNFSHAQPRRLVAEQLWDALTIATGSTNRFAGVPKDFRATQLPDAEVASGGFLDLFGRPPRESACECERRSETSFAQALNLVNGDTIASAVADPKGRVAELVKAETPPPKLVEEIYLSGVCRLPNEDERKAGVEHVTTAASMQEGAEDLMWALLNSPEFLFNH